MFCYWGIVLLGDTEIKVRLERYKVSPGYWGNVSLYEEYYGINEGVSSE